MNKRFNGRKVLITGAGSGIGRACAKRFAAEGAVINAADVDLTAAEATVKELGSSPAHLAVQVDVRLETSVRSLFETVGKVDVLVNSAGVREIAPCLDLTTDEWQRVIDINLTGTFLMSQGAAREMVTADAPGKIVNLASVAGLTAVPNRAAYVASKHAVVGLTKEMAMELGTYGIQVNAVGPGVVETEMTASYFNDSELVESIQRAHLSGRWAQPEEIAAVIAFLASSEADFITGATYPVDGGFLAGKGI